MHASRHVIGQMQRHASAAASAGGVMYRYVPDRSYLKSLLSHLQPRLISCSPDSLAMALWGLAALRQQIPSNTWAAAWCTAAAGKADQFGPQALAHGLSAMAALGVRPPAQLMQVGGLGRVPAHIRPHIDCVTLVLTCLVDSYPCHVAQYASAAAYLHCCQYQRVV